MRQLTFAPRDAGIACADIDAAASAAADRLDRFGYAVFRIGQARWDADRSRARAAELMTALRNHLVARGAPAATTVEAGPAQATIMPAATTVRTMLPHHDGQHASFLTPSRHDVPDFPPRWRVFADDGYTTSHTHKLYQAIFIAEPGEGLSVTPVYDLLRILADAYRHRSAGNPSVTELASWLGENLRLAHALRPAHGSVYPTLAGLLGLDDVGLQATPLIRAEADLDEDHLARFPWLRPLVGQCPCGTCVGGTLRLFCRVSHLGLGLDWPSLRARYETCVVTERYDLLVTHNLTMLHGGLAGGPSRVLEPFYLALPRADGEEYERWLARQWRVRP